MEALIFSYTRKLSMLFIDIEINKRAFQHQLAFKALSLEFGKTEGLLSTAITPSIVRIKSLLLLRGFCIVVI